MKCPTNSCKNIAGFTLLEVVITISIIGLLSTLSSVAYRNYKMHENLDISTTEIVEAVRHAQANAQVGKADSAWGLKIFSNNAILFKGSSYTSRDINADQNFSFPGGVIASGITEIVFEKISGSTNNVGNITLTNNFGTQNIFVNEKGTVTY